MLRLRPSLRGLAVSLHGPRLGELDPFRAGLLAVLEAARNVACAGGEPLALTDCLNFGNPEKPEIAWELGEAIEAMAHAAEALGIPVVSGNVSLYNETDGRPIPPTPVVGCVGLVDGRPRACPRGWREGDVVLRRPRADGLDGRSRARPLPRARRRACSRSRTTSATAASPAALAEAALWSGVGAERRAPRRARACRSRAAPETRRQRSAREFEQIGDRRRRDAPRRRRSTSSATAWEATLMCGVFGIRSPDRDVARLAYFGLFALQHRGQESAGIAVSDRGRLTVLREMGLVTQVFNEQKLRGLRGELAIGHTRYSTTGSTQWANAQPLVHHGRARTVALGHNGNLTNAAELRDELRERGRRASHSTSDTEVIAALIANDPAPLEEAVAHAMAQLDGAFSVVALAEGRLVAFRDPHGFRPLCLGRLGDDWVVASETCALDLVGAELRARGRAAASSW